MKNLTPQEIQNIKDHYDRLTRYDEKLRIAKIRNNENIDELVNVINDIFERNNVKDRIDNTQIKFSGGYIGNLENVSDKKLSSIIFNEVFPNPSEKRYSHFTSFQGAKSILENKELRLFNLLNNFKDEEFRLFYKEHGIDGYKTMSEVFGVKTDYRSIMSEIYALCLTSEQNESDEVWEYFGFNGTGIKLTFEIDSKIPDFREVYYSDTQKANQIPLLKDLFQSVQSEYQCPFNFSYISKIGGFYIHGKFSNEKEFRFLVKRNSDSYNAFDFTPVTYMNDVSYIVLPFQSSLANFKLVNVKKGPNCSIINFNILKEIISQNYENVEFEE